MRKYITIICLTVITIIELLTGFGGVALMLWFGYGIYKMHEHD